MYYTLIFKLTPARVEGLSATPSTTSRSLAENNLKEQVAEINEKLKQMVKLHEKADLTSVVGEEPKTQEEMEDHIDELCISTGKSKLASVYKSNNMTHCKNFSC